MKKQEEDVVVVVKAAWVLADIMLMHKEKSHQGRKTTGICGDCFSVQASHSKVSPS